MRKKYRLILILAKKIVYAENCELHYIVCTYIDNMGTMMGQEFFETLNQAKLYFNK